MFCYRSPTTSGPNPAPDGPCTHFILNDGFSSCCDLSHAAQCMPASLCYQPAWVRLDGTGSGWLTASCTDKSYRSGACNRHCVDNPIPDVVYNNSTGLWACCGVNSDGTVDCNNPTSETFQGEVPEVLLGKTPSSSLQSKATSTTTTSSSRLMLTSTSGSEQSSTTTSTSIQSGSQSPSEVAVMGSARGSSAGTSSSSGLSTGGKAGIGIGVALGVIGVVCVAVAVLLMRRQKRQQECRFLDVQKDLSSAATTLPLVHGYTDANGRGTVQELSGDGQQPGRGGGERFELAS